MPSDTSSPSLAAQQDYYDHYWQAHQHALIPHEVVRLARILDAIALAMPAFAGREIRICDLGCGRGWLSQELCKFGRVTAVDLSPAAVEEARARYPQVSFVAADILAWRPDECFDLVVTSEVIEHVPDQQKFADTVRHLLRRGGLLILTTPNGRVQKEWDAGGQGRQIIENWLTPRGLRHLFGDFAPLQHKIFILDFSYAGIFRLLSAPKLLRLLAALRLTKLYDFSREQLGLGLYQLFLARYAPDTRQGD